MECFILLVNISIMVYLLVDAPKHGRNQLPWAILGLFFGVIPLGIYLIMTGRKVVGITIISVYFALIILSVFLITFGILLYAAACASGCA